MSESHRSGVFAHRQGLGRDRYEFVRRADAPLSPILRPHGSRSARLSRLQVGRGLSPADDAAAARCLSWRSNRQRPEASDTIALAELADASQVMRQLLVQLTEPGSPVDPFHEREGGLAFDLLSSRLPMDPGRAGRVANGPRNGHTPPGSRNRRRTKLTIRDRRCRECDASAGAQRHSVLDNSVMPPEYAWLGTRSRLVSSRLVRNPVGNVSYMADANVALLPCPWSCNAARSISRPRLRGRVADGQRRRIGSDPASQVQSAQPIDTGTSEKRRVPHFTRASPCRWSP